LQETANCEQSENENETPNYRHRDRTGVFTQCGAETYSARDSLLLRSTRFLFLFRHEVLLYPESLCHLAAQVVKRKALTLQCAIQSAPLNDGTIYRRRGVVFVTISNASPRR